MSREFKGKSTTYYAEDYCILDLETTSIHLYEASIIEISAIRVRANTVVSEFSTLVNPLLHIPEEATAINHITDDMVKNAPLLNDVIDDFLTFVGNDIIVGYNIASFDLNLIYDNVYTLRKTHFSNDYIDVLHAAQRSLKGMKNYRLETICSFYNLDTTGEHRALKDCFLTKSCYDILGEHYGNDAFTPRCRTSNEIKPLKYSPETTALRELCQLTETILKDNVIVPAEFDLLRTWAENHICFQNTYPFDVVFSTIDRITADGKIEPAELEELREILLRCLDPIKNQEHHEQICSFSQKHICITGEFDYGSREDVFVYLKSIGAIVDTNIKKSTTDYLIVGAQGSDKWKTGNYGGKIQKAMEYNHKGADIKIIEESEFIAMAQHCHTLLSTDNLVDEKSSFPHAAALQETFNAIIAEKHLPQNSIRLKSNPNQDKSVITSYSVCIYEPPYPDSLRSTEDPSKNTIVMNIKPRAKNIVLLIDKTQFQNIDKPLQAEYKMLKTEATNAQVIFPVTSPELVPYIRKHIEYALKNYTAKSAPFGCCSKYAECSDAKHCLHQNKLYSCACIYRKHLEAGEIFYGENKSDF